MAPSGKAAAAIDGITIHKAMLIPCGHKARSKMKPLGGPSKIRLQNTFAGVKAIIIDEFSMLSQKMLSTIDLRCREARPEGANLPFGGMLVLLCGDPAQLPPVGGSCLWHTATGREHLGNELLAGRGLYYNFKWVIKLVGSNRLIEDELKPYFQALLEAVRNGTVSLEQFEQLNQYTQENGIVQRIMQEEECNRQTATEIFRQRFESNLATFFYNTNEEILKHNLKQLRHTGHPICKVKAFHNVNAAAAGSEEQARRLPTLSYFSVNSKVLLTWNLNVTLKLVNGSTGIIKDIIFAPNTSAVTDLPIAIIVEFAQYSGRRFFEDRITNLETGETQDRSKWVPISVSTAEWYTSNNVTLQRTMFPLSLAWAWTPWKGQGSTCHGPCVIYPGDNEKSTGLLYVMLSRATTLKNVHIPRGITFNRMTEEINKKASTQQRIEEEARLLHLSQITEYAFRMLANIV